MRWVEYIRTAAFVIATALVLATVACADAGEAPIRVVCDDGNPCTFDQYVEPFGPCLHHSEEDGTDCEDDEYCNGQDLCFDGECLSTGDPCLDLPCGVCDEQFDTCFEIDADSDFACDDVDNCPETYNPDQLNSDCPFSYYPAADACPGGVAVSGIDAGCCDGGDVCDRCPASANDDLCDELLSGGVTVGPEGGSYYLGGRFGIHVPQGALDWDTSISVSTRIAAAADPDINDNELRLDRAGGVALRESVMLPAGQWFNEAVSLEFWWDDIDGDGIVDLGLCANGYTPCSSDATCTSSGADPPCIGGGRLEEAKMLVRHNGMSFDYRGLDASTSGSVARCGDPEQQDPGFCGEGAVITQCGDPGAGNTMSVANCCDDVTNRWPLQTCSFSDFYVGRLEGALVPGKGSTATDCVIEWTVVNPFNEPAFDKKGYVSFKQICRDGDVTCDADGAIDGSCTFLLGACVNVEDDRLYKRAGEEPACNPSDIATVEIKKPRPTSTRPTEWANGQALRAAVADLSPNDAEIGGSRMEVVKFSPPYDARDACTRVVPFVVPLRGSDFSRAGRGKIGIQATTSGTGSNTDAVSDKDKMKFYCLPAF